MSSCWETWTSNFLARASESSSVRISFSTASRASFFALGLASSPTRCSTWWSTADSGQDDLDLVEEDVDEGVARGEGLLGFLGLGGLLLEVLGQLLQGVEFGHHLGEVVVGLGQLASLHGLDGDGDLGLFTLVVAALEGGREGDLVAGLGAAQRGVLAVEHGAGADLVGDVGGGVNLLAVDRGDQVDGREVAGLGLAVDGLQGREAAAQVVEFLLHVLVGDLGGLDLDDDGLVDLGQLERGNDRDLGGEDELSALGAGHVRDLGDVNLGLSHGGAGRSG